MAYFIDDVEHHYYGQPVWSYDPRTGCYSVEAYYCGAVVRVSLTPDQISTEKPKPFRSRGWVENRGFYLEKNGFDFFSYLQRVKDQMRIFPVLHGGRR